MSDFQTLMQESFDAHQKFKLVWGDWRSGKLKDAKGLKPHTEPKSVIEARNNFLAKNDLLFDFKIKTLDRKLKESPNAPLSEIIEFLSVDITAFRCGYAKEYFLKWIKQTELSKKQIKELQNLVLKVCELNSFRREFRRWCRLAVRIADEHFIEEVQNLAESKSHFERIKSRWILEMIQQNRLDLRKKINENQK